MTSPADLRDDFTRYAKLIEARLAGATFTDPAESATTLRIDRGIVLAQSLSNPSPASDPVGRLIELAHSDRLSQVSVIDAAGHQRPVYRPLLAYAWLLAFRIRYESLSPDQFGRWDESLRVWADLLEADLGRAGVSDQANPAARGDGIAAAAWSALALQVAGKIFIRDAWTDLASDTFGRLSRAQQPNGSFLLATASDNPEPLWYHELAILHATTSYAVQTEDRNAARAVMRSSNLHLNETQPDHATSQPWGIFAFIWNAPARPVADQMLHAVTLNPSPDGVSLILLADALYSLRLFL